MMSIREFASDYVNNRGYCDDMLTDLYKEDLYTLAVQMGLPTRVTRKTTKAVLCQLIREFMNNTPAPIGNANRQSLLKKIRLRTPYEVFRSSGWARGLTDEQAQQMWDSDPSIEEHWINYLVTLNNRRN